MASKITTMGRKTLPGLLTFDIFNNLTRREITELKQEIKRKEQNQKSHGNKSFLDPVQDRLIQVSDDGNDDITFRKKFHVKTAQEAVKVRKILKDNGLLLYSYKSEVKNPIMRLLHSILFAIKHPPNYNTEHLFRDLKYDILLLSEYYLTESKEFYHGKSFLMVEKEIVDGCVTEEVVVTIVHFLRVNIELIAVDGIAKRYGNYQQMVKIFQTSRDFFFPVLPLNLEQVELLPVTDVADITSYLNHTTDIFDNITVTPLSSPNPQQKVSFIIVLSYVNYAQFHNSIKEQFTNNSSFADGS